MKTRFTTSFDELIKNRYGASAGVPQPTTIEDLFAGYYGKPARCHGTERKGPSVVVSLSFNDGETLGQPPGKDRFEEYVVQQSAADVPFEEYVVMSASLSAPSSTAARASDDVSASEEYRVDVLQPTTSEPGPAANCAGCTCPPPSPPMRGEAKRSITSPQPAETSTATSRAQATDDDFVADMQSILSGQKMYDPQSKKTVDKDRLGRPASTESAPAPATDASSSQAIFDRIAQSLAYANTYDLGTVELTNRFADFDRIADLQDKVAEDKRKKQAPAGGSAPSGPAVDTEDFLKDLENIRNPSRLLHRPQYGKSQDTGDAQPVSQLRAAILAQLDKWAGALEGGPVFDKEFMPPPVIDEQRKIAGKSGYTYTTCIAFQQRVLTNAAAAVRGVQTDVIGTKAEERARKIPGAWHDGAPTMTDRPAPGDIYVLAKKDKLAEFSHIGFIKAIAVNSDGTETWTTVDGGQGRAGKYDKDGNVTQAGKEAILEVSRTYFPTSNLIKGEANQGGDQRLVKGWVDVDKLVQPEAAASSLGRSLSQPSFSRPFYDTGEHILMGGDRYAGLLRLGKGGGVPFSYGQIIAMGDLYGTVDDMMNADVGELQRLKALMERDTEFYRARVAGQASRQGVSNQEWEDATNKRFLKLAANNYEHFSPVALFQGAAFAKPTSFGDNRSAWERHHQRAIEEAQKMFLAPENANRTFFPEWPLTINAFGDHYLTDAFSAGHLINKEAMIGFFKANFYSGGAVKADGKNFFGEVAKQAFTGDVKNKFSKLETADYKWFKGFIPVGHPGINDADRFAQVLCAVAEQKPEEIGNITVKALHDRLNTDGIEVTNKAGDGTWRLTGDGTLNRQNLDIIQKAVQQSIDDLSDPGIYKSNLDFVPFFAGVWDHVPLMTPASRGNVEKLIGEYTNPKSSVLIAAAAKIITDQVDLLIAKLIEAGALRKA